MPENRISCSIRYFPEDNSLVEAVVFVQLPYREKNLLPPFKKILNSSKDFLCLYLPIFICCGKDQGDKVRGQRCQENLQLRKASTQIPAEGLMAPQASPGVK